MFTPCDTTASRSPAAARRRPPTPDCDDRERIGTLLDSQFEHLRAHSLFHCVPIEGMAHLRTTMQEALELARGLTCSGNVTGRAKPMFAAMTDIGKLILYEGAILERRDRDILLQSHYRLADRRRWNPGWQLPRTAEVDRQGRLRVRYLDGPEHSH